MGEQAKRPLNQDPEVDSPEEDKLLREFETLSKEVGTLDVLDIAVENLSRRQAHTSRLKPFHMAVRGFKEEFLK